eukprot:4719396-Pleurochrysis_carterae.AAC.5
MRACARTRAGDAHRTPMRRRSRSACSQAQTCRAEQAWTRARGAGVRTRSRTARPHPPLLRTTEIRTGKAWEIWQ